MVLNKLTFYKGEKREVTATITSKNTKEVVVIASAEYELFNTCDNSIVQKGSGEITGNEVTVLLDLIKKGNYKLKITSHVGREVIINKTFIDIK